MRSGIGVRGRSRKGVGGLSVDGVRDCRYVSNLYVRTVIVFLVEISIDRTIE